MKGIKLGLKMSLVVLVMLSLITLSFSSSHSSDVTNRFKSAMCNLYNFLRDILPVALVLVIILAGVVFVIGQALGAETRARANVWATNMIIMSVIAVIVVYLFPWLIDQLVPELGINQACS